MKLIKQADVVLALGSRLGPFGTLPQYDIDYWPADAKLIQVDEGQETIIAEQPGAPHLAKLDWKNHPTFTAWHEYDETEGRRKAEAFGVDRMKVEVRGKTLTAWLGAVKLFIGVAMVDEVAVRGLILTPPVELQFETVFFGLAILVLSEIFRQASELKNERSLTI